MILSVSILHNYFSIGSNSDCPFHCFPISPFLAGFIGASFRDIDNEKIVYFGILSSLCLFFPLLIILKYTSTFGEIGWGYSILISLILSGYIWFGSTIGALVKFGLLKNNYSLILLFLEL